MPAMAAGGASLGDLYSKCVQMVNENKISTKNAWELPLIDHIDDIVSSFMGGKAIKTGQGQDQGAGRKSSGGTGAGAHLSMEENRFHEASCTIEASARIYACRVDCVHTDTYRVLGGLNSTDVNDDDPGDDGKGPASKRRRIVGVNTLEKNENNIVQNHLEVDEQSDPGFRRMAAAFDAGGAKGLLLSHLPLAEDMSLVFNGDVSLKRPRVPSKNNSDPKENVFSSDATGMGDPKVACSKFANSRICAEIDFFRQQFLGGAHIPAKLPLSDRLEHLLGPLQAGSTTIGFNGPTGLNSVPLALGLGAAVPLEDASDGGDQFDDGPLLEECFHDDVDDALGPPDLMQNDAPAAAAAPEANNSALPLGDAERALVAVDTTLQGSEDVIAFDELFKKFCGTGATNQFAYFDECWSKVHKDPNPKDQGNHHDTVLGADGVIVPADGPSKEKQPKKPLFDITGLGKPPKPIETEPVHKHQLSERAVQWQLHKDVPPYMIDRITMPSWPTWSKCDFACLGLRPHLMLKLVRKPVPESEGPHSFSDLFSTVVVENPEAFPWLAADARGAAAAWRNEENDDDVARAEREMECDDDVDDDDFAGHGGLPAHLDVDPQDLFLRPGDRVLPGSGEGDRDGDDDHEFHDDGPDMMDDDGFQPDMDLDLVDRPAIVGDTDISYSRNSKFVDVKLVKKHLWDCINEDIDFAKSEEITPKETDSSFQALVNRTMRRLPKAETANLSVAVCFICALHLCNEKGLELRIDNSKPLGDFAVVGQPA